MGDRCRAAGSRNAAGQTGGTRAREPREGSIRVGRILRRRQHGRRAHDVWGLGAGARRGCNAAGGTVRAVSSKTDEAPADAVGEGVDEVGEAVSDVDVVDDGGAEGEDGLVEEREGVGDVFFGGAEGEGFEEDDGDGDDAEEGADGGVAEVAFGVEPFDDDAEDVAAGADDFVDVVAVIAVPAGEGAERDGAARVGRGGTHAVGLGVGLLGGVVGAALDDGLEGEGVYVDAGVFIFNTEDMAELRWNFGRVREDITHGEQTTNLGVQHRSHASSPRAESGSSAAAPYIFQTSASHAFYVDWGRASDCPPP